MRSKRLPIPPIAVDHGYILGNGPEWFEGADVVARGLVEYRVHCAVPGCGAAVRNLGISRANHLRMHRRAAAKAARTRQVPPVTQVEIARAAGLDVSTVNKILNEVPGPVFRVATIDRVHAIAEHLGYRHPRNSKKIAAEAGRALIEAARWFMREPGPGSLAGLELALRDAEQLWPAPAAAEREGKAVGA